MLLAAGKPPSRRLRTSPVAQEPNLAGLPNLRVAKADARHIPSPTQQEAPPGNQCYRYGSEVVGVRLCCTSPVAKTPATPGCVNPVTDNAARVQYPFDTVTSSKLVAGAATRVFPEYLGCAALFL